MSHRVVAGVATHCSPSVRPLTGHPHVVWLTHAHSATVHGRLRCPFLCSPPFPFAHALCLPARRRLSWRGPRALAGRRGACGFPLSRPRLPRDVHAVGVGSASAHVVGARRLSGARSLPIAHTGEFSLVGVQALTCGSWACDIGRAACGRVATGLRRGRGPRRSEGCRSPWVRPG